jgi:hypothetical protein
VGERCKGRSAAEASLRRTRQMWAACEGAAIGHEEGKERKRISWNLAEMLLLLTWQSITGEPLEPPLVPEAACK